jgi:uncharacterized RDD family membrane protein YckC
MALRRPRPPKPSFCPACDAALSGDVATADDPRCAACDTPLLPVKVAGAWQRIGAGAVDAVILLFTAGPLSWMLAKLSETPPLLGGKTALEMLLRAFEVDFTTWLGRAAPLMVMAGVYLGLFWHLSGRTPGEKLLRIRVVDSGGRRPSIARTAVRVLATLAGGIVGMLGWLWIAVDLEKRAWHDWLAGTYVVRDGK